MIVCDKCRKQIEKGTRLDIKGTKAEICDECAAKIVQWLKEPVKKQGILGMLGGGN